VTDAAHMAATVESRREVTPALCIVRLIPEERLLFAAGQYVTIGLPEGSRIVERPYSMVSSPREPGLEFFVELVPGGKLTPALCDMPAGSRVFLRRLAKGRFLFDRQSGHAKHFMVASVTGIAPFVSMVREFIETEAQGGAMRQAVTLLHSASMPDEFGYLEELRGYAARHAWLQYVPTVSRIWLAPEWRGEAGRSEDVLRKYLDAQGCSPADTTVYLCGNPNMIENARGILIRAGFGKDSIKEEEYWPAVA
jgi:ferredoxin--NADP+ reductase